MLWIRLKRGVDRCFRAASLDQKKGSVSFGRRNRVQLINNYIIRGSSLLFIGGLEYILIFNLYKMEPLAI